MFGNITQLPSGRFRARHLHPERKLVDGKRNYVNAPETFRTKTDARKWLTKQDALISSGMWIDPKEAKLEPTFSEYAEQVIKQRNVSDSTQSYYEKWLENHVNPTFGQMKLKDITKPLVREWLGTVAPGKPSAREHAYRIFSLVMLQAEDDELILKSPCQKKLLEQIAPAPLPPNTRQRRKRVIRALTEEQIEELAKYLPTQYQDLVRFMGQIGLRVGEATEIRGTDLKEVEELGLVLTVARTYSNGRISPTTKTGKSREVLLPSYFADLFKDRLGSPELLFPSSHGTNIDPANLRSSMNHYSPFGHVTPHDLRHSAITNMHKKGVGELVIMQISGHSSRAMSAHYTHPDVSWQEGVWAS